MLLDLSCFWGLLLLILPLVWVYLMTSPKFYIYPSAISPEPHQNPSQSLLKVILCRLCYHLYWLLRYAVSSNTQYEISISNQNCSGILILATSYCGLLVVLWFVFSDLPMLYDFLVSTLHGFFWIFKVLTCTLSPFD